jgi:hypothetical protein
VTRIVLLVLVTAATTIGGVAALAGGSVATETGLTGKVLRGPTTPVCRFNTPCYAPYNGVLVFTPVGVATSGDPAVRTQATAQGNYTVKLAATRYRVTTGVRSRFRGVVKPAFVTVSTTAGMKRVNFVVDTGIR